MTLASKAIAEDPDAWMSLQAAMDALGLSRVRVLGLVVKGDLVAQHIASRTVVRRDSVERLKEARAAAV